MRANSVILILFLLFVGISACKKTPPTPVDNTPKLDVEFIFKVDNQVLTVGQEYTNILGQKFDFSLAQFYVSGIELVGPSPKAFNDCYLLPNPNQLKFRVGDIPAAHYHGIKFRIGVDSAANHSDPTTYANDHPLSPNHPNYAHWSWNLGYVFIKLEGDADTSAAITGNKTGFHVYHIGTNPLAREVNLTKHHEVEEGDVYTIQIEVDLGQVMNLLDFRFEHDSHTGNNMPTAIKIADALSTAFTIAN